VDRNANAALNLRDWTGAVGIGKVDADRDVQRGGVAAPVPHVPPKRASHGGQAHWSTLFGAASIEGWLG
jgi:hypothetical protein